MPPVDPRSPTGYADGVRGLVVGSIGWDGLHWIMQTQAMAAGEGARIRQVDYDNAPIGREVHWSSAVRWWLAAAAAIDRASSGRSFALSVEQASRFANPLLLAILLIVGVPAAARAFGGVAAAAFALGIIAVRPFYTAFMAGGFDHHGLAVAAPLASLFCLLAGRLPGETTDPAIVRRWTIASGVAGGVGLWISAATTTPVLIAVGIGGIASAWIRGDQSIPATSDARLWRLWGIAGAATSVALYLVEYLPSHLGWRLEVNHPLFAVSWLGGAELVAQIRAWRAGMRPDTTTLAFAVVAAIALPATIVLTGSHTFWVADDFLWRFHADYIGEFGSLASAIASMPAHAWLREVSLLPVVALAVPLLVWRSLSPAARAVLIIAWAPGLVALMLAVQQRRWMVLTGAVWLAILPATIAILSREPTFARSGRHVVAGVIALAIVLLPSPVLAIRDWAADETRGEADFAELRALVMRDVARAVRARHAGGPAVVLSDPTTTSLLIYYGGLRGIGTLYWENLPGLRAMREILETPSEERARELLTAHGVTEIVLVSWDAYTGEVLSRGESFIAHMARSSRIPSWIRALRYPLPPHELLDNERVQILEVIAGR